METYEAVKVLGVVKSKSFDEIRKRYKELVIKWHPDRNEGNSKAKAEDKFQKISEAFEIIEKYHKDGGEFPIKKSLDISQAYTVPIPEVRKVRKRSKVNYVPRRDLLNGNSNDNQDIVIKYIESYFSRDAVPVDKGYSHTNVQSDTNFYNPSRSIISNKEREKPKETTRGQAGFVLVETPKTPHSSTSPVIAAHSQNIHQRHDAKGNMAPFGQYFSTGNATVGNGSIQHHQQPHTPYPSQQISVLGNFVTNSVHYNKYLADSQGGSFATPIFGQVQYAADGSTKVGNFWLQFMNGVAFVDGQPFQIYLHG